jgi:hypothetical protein
MANYSRDISVSVYNNLKGGQQRAVMMLLPVAGAFVDGDTMTLNELDETLLQPTGRYIEVATPHAFAGLGCAPGYAMVCIDILSVYPPEG